MNDDKEALINIALHSVAALERMDALQGISDEDILKFQKTTAAYVSRDQGGVQSEV